MFNKYRIDKNGNRYYSYDLKETPACFVQVEPRQVKNKERGKLLRAVYTQNVINPILVERVRQWHKQGKLDEYDFHHIHPTGLGGTNDLTNICLIPKELHKKLHHFLQLEKCAPILTQMAQEMSAQNKKIFVSMPKLPFIVKQSDLSFLPSSPQCVVSNSSTVQLFNLLKIRGS